MGYTILVITFLRNRSEFGFRKYIETHKDEDFMYRTKDDIPADIYHTFFKPDLKRRHSTMER